MNNINERTDFSHFGKSFQEKFVRLLLEDRVFCEQVAEVLDLNFLELKYLRVFALTNKYVHLYDEDTGGIVTHC